MKKIYVGGAQGVGKDYALNIYRTHNPDINIIHFADRMKEIAKTSNNDTLLRTLTFRQRGEIRDQVFQEIEECLSPVIVNGHYSLPIRNNYSDEILRFEDGVPPRFYGLFTDYVLMTIPDSLLLNRRMKDLPRGRDILENNIAQELKQERNAFFKINGVANKYITDISDANKIVIQLEQIVRGVI